MPSCVVRAKNPEIWSTDQGRLVKQGRGGRVAGRPELQPGDDADGTYRDDHHQQQPPAPEYAQQQRPQVERQASLTLFVCRSAGICGRDPLELDDGIIVGNRHRDPLQRTDIL